MTVFHQTLESLVGSVPGAIGVAFVDWEGETVAAVSELASPQMELAGAHMGIIWHQVTERLRRAELGVLEELWLDTTDQRFLLWRVTDRYYLVLNLRAEAHLANARKHLGGAAMTLREGI